MRWGTGPTLGTRDCERYGKIILEDRGNQTGWCDMRPAVGKLSPKRGELNQPDLRPRPLKPKAGEAAGHEGIKSMNTVCENPAGSTTTTAPRTAADIAASVL